MSYNPRHALVSSTSTTHISSRTINSGTKREGDRSQFIPPRIESRLFSRPKDKNDPSRTYFPNHWGHPCFRTSVLKLTIDSRDLILILTAKRNNKIRYSLGISRQICNPADECPYGWISLELFSVRSCTTPCIFLLVPHMDQFPTSWLSTGHTLSGVSRPTPRCMSFTLNRPVEWLIISSEQKRNSYNMKKKQMKHVSMLSSLIYTLLQDSAGTVYLLSHCQRPKIFPDLIHI